MKEKKSKTLGERLPESTIADKLFRAAAQRVAREARSQSKASGRNKKEKSVVI